MLASWPTETHAATRISDAVPRRIERDAFAPIEVHSVYRSVVNLSTGDGLLSIASPATGGLPNGILVDLGPDLRALGLRPGMPVVATSVSVGVKPVGLLIDLVAAVRWSPRLAVPRGGTSIAADRWRLRSSDAWSTARDMGAIGGFGPILRDDRSGGHDRDMVRQARGMVDRLWAGLSAGDQADASVVGRGLIGLGPGLTPSGDDLLSGLEAGLHALDAACAGFLAQAIGDVDDRTTAVAATLLRHAARGEFAERIHILVGALLDASGGAIPAAIERSVAWGATSGTDCLLGVLLGLDIASGLARQRAS